MTNSLNKLIVEAATNLEKNPVRDEVLSLGQHVYHTPKHQHPQFWRASEFKYGKVVHHTGRHATVQWEDGSQTKHLRGSGIQVGFYDGHNGRWHMSKPGALIAHNIVRTEHGNNMESFKGYIENKYKTNPTADAYDKQLEDFKRRRD